MIPQPPVPADIPVAPKSKRVDLSMPTFSDPTNVTNPLFPVSKQDSVLMVGHVDGKPFRTEVTLLPETRIIEWQGQRIETLVSQYTAYLDGRIQEVAYDLYAQAYLPMLPEEIPRTPAVLPAQALWPYGREAWSMAFFSTPGIERLYSGVTKITPCADAISFFSRFTGGAWFLSSSWL